MMDEHRDPELEAVRTEWQAPAPSPQFHERALQAFEDEFVRIPWWRKRWLIAAVIVSAGIVIAAALLRPSREIHYVPVSQPHFMIVSAGEHP